MRIGFYTHRRIIVGIRNMFHSISDVSISKETMARVYQEYLNSEYVSAECQNYKSSQVTENNVDCEKDCSYGPVPTQR